MSDEWVDRVTAVIRSGDLVAYPLDRLREELRRRFGSEPPDPGELRRLLLGHPDRFVLIEPEPLPLHGADQDGAAEILGVLRSAGLFSVSQVMLRGETEPAPDVETAAAVTRAVSRSLTALWNAGSAGTLRRAELVQATRAANQLRGRLRRLSASPPLPSPAPAAGGTRSAGPPAAVQPTRWARASTRAGGAAEPG